MITDDQHRELLRQVIQFGPSFSEAVLGIQGLGFDGRQGVAQMTVADARDVLRRAIDGEVSDADLTRWADTIEGREDIELDPVAFETLTELLFVISNPEINGRDDKILADWLRRLMVATTSSHSLDDG